MKTFVHGILAATVLLAGTGFAGGARADAQYSIVIQAKGEAARFVITAPQATKLGLKVEVSLAKGQEKTVSVPTENVVYYEFALTLCGKTDSVRFARAGRGVTIEIVRCGVYYFNKIS